MTVLAAVEPNQQLPAERILQAAHWHSLMLSGEQSLDDEQAFNDWRLDAQNAEAYQRIVEMWGQVDVAELKPARKTLESVLSDQKGQRRKSRRRAAGAVASTFVLTVGLLFGIQTVPGESLWSCYLASGRLFSDFNTAVGEHQLIELSDGTRVHLNTFSAINVEYTQDHRAIYLLQGEVQLDVAKDTRRPLIVLSEQGSARALGTQFSVRDHGHRTEVSVTESRVEVCSLGEVSSAGLDDSRCEQLQAGEKTQVDQYRVQVPRAIDMGFTRDWGQQLLIVDNQPVLDVLDELSRYRSGYVRLDRAGLSDYTVSGVFPLNDFKKSLEVLEGSLPITVTHYTPLLTIVRPNNL